MAEISFKRGTKASLEQEQLKDGLLSFTTDDGKIHLDFIDKNNEYFFVDKDDIQERNDVNLLDEESYKTLFNEIGRGSIYLSDYKNSVGCTCEDVCDFCESYYEWLQEEYGDDADNLDNIEMWLTYAGF